MGNRALWATTIQIRARKRYTGMGMQTIRMAQFVGHAVVQSMHCWEASVTTLPAIGHCFLELALDPVNTPAVCVLRLSTEMILPKLYKEKEIPTNSGGYSRSSPCHSKRLIYAMVIVVLP